MKRLIILAFVVVTIVLTLSGCGEQHHQPIYPDWMVEADRRCAGQLRHVRVAVVYHPQHGGKRQLRAMCHDGSAVDFITNVPEVR